MKKIIIGILVLGVGVMSFFSFRGEPSKDVQPAEKYEILQKWELPDVLEEVSGIAWIGDQRIACIQDEDGIIFIYNLETSEVERSTVYFAGGGDYEGIAVLENHAYVLRSDGVVFEVLDFLTKDPRVRKYVTEINQLPGINIEGFCADPANNRLLLAVKERRGFMEHKEIYAFDLTRKDTAKDPFFMVDLSDNVFSEVKNELKDKFMPGEIGIHPQTGEFYILDGSSPKLLITDKNGIPKELFMFHPADFGNPEGLTFSPEGDLYISNEAEDGPANILRVSLKREM